MNFSSPVLSIEIEGHVATLWLDRPEKRNAMSHEMWSNFPAAMDAIAAEPEVRAVVLAGRGKSFCVGIDLADLGNQPAASDQKGDGKKSGALANLRQMGVTRAFQDAITAVAECPLPVIAS